MSHVPPDDSPLKASRREVSRLLSGVELGHEPPLSANGASAPEVDKREINLRWLGASVLTGVTGAVLIGASIHISIEGATTSVQAPELATVTAYPRPEQGGERATNVARKSNRLNMTELMASAKQSFKAPMTIRNGDREAIKVRQFVKIATNLSLSTGTYASDIPPFNPMRLFAEDTQEKIDQPPEIADADVSVLRRDLAAMAIEASAPALSDGDVLAMLEEERRVAGETGRRAAAAIPAQQMLSRTLRQPEGLGDALGYARVVDTPFSTIEVRVMPENVTDLPKIEQKALAPLIEERDVVFKKGETLETVLRSYGATPEQIAAISTALSARLKIANMAEGQRLRILIAPGPRLGDPRQIVRVIAFGEKGIEGIAATNDRGAFVSVTPPDDLSDHAAVADAQEEEENEDGKGGARLYESLYETALKNDLPPETVEELVRIFGYDVDFQRRVAQGDSFEVFFGADDDDDTPEVLYASLTVGGEARRVYRFQGEDGSIDYFDETGRSLKKFLLRKPISEGILRSGFGSRFHPILGYTRPHTGIDWSNRVGTPILAAGNGVVRIADWKSGYGRHIELQHANGYVTTYSHMSGFAKNMAPGVRVKQGQVIGYLGSTGLSTGPHLHYEVLINGSFVDPLKIRLPQGRELDGRSLAEFKRQREQVDSLMSQASATASLSQRAELR
ncbi:M23 family metallopeptidase [Microvirga guangxiensis]|uniref:Murein DD-endopeptidase MepM and murein hydrolase activator NlpD, contain LysM domain n=1 Tax=Microvirga guangxiensis TaxID=549386 RepID=A0A1G5H673_9HYPH|nr:M23 family metallopeptidase [Microvirga guangxiensis]SCY59303.1 Murein DD-endopeptidase MepM and murein hydrolase activator NlpD, contain LysM domain [Microvirga guangxiensis]